MDEKILNLLTEINQRLTNVESDVRSIKLYQENVLDKNINLLAENVSSANERLISIESDVIELKDNQTISDVFTELAAAFSRK